MHSSLKKIVQHQLNLVTLYHVTRDFPKTLLTFSKTVAAPVCYSNYQDFPKEPVA